MVRVLSVSGPAKLIFILLSITSRQGSGHGQKRTQTEKYFTNGWAVRVEGGIEVAKRLAEEHGFEKVESVRIILYLEMSKSGVCFRSGCVI